MNMRKAVLVMLAPLLLSCGGCSLVSFGYNHADVALRHWLGDYASFTAPQQREIDHAIADYLAWHRSHALPEYIAFLQQLYVLADRERPLSIEEVARLRADLVRLYRLTMTPAARPAAHVLATLDSQQIGELRATFARQNRELRRELLPGDARENLAARAKAHIKMAEGLVGNLSRAQERQISELSLRIPFATEDYLRQREARQAALLALLEQHAGEDRITAFLLDWINRHELPGLPQKQATAAYDDALNDMIARSYALLSEEQRKHLLAKIAAYIGAFQELHTAAQGAAAAH